jgi:hypothetical protein
VPPVLVVLKEREALMDSGVSKERRAKPVFRVPQV